MLTTRLPGGSKLTHSFWPLFILLKTSLAARLFTINNNCNDTIWPAYTAAVATMGTGGWEAPAKSSNSVNLPDGWNGRFWARQVCDFKGGVNCVTGSCAGGLNCTGAGSGPVTLVELSLGGAGSPLNADFYDISIVSGFNLPVELKSNTACPSISCPTNFNPVCPPSLQAATTSNGTTLACKVNEPDYSWFRQNCPGVYVSPTDDQALNSNSSCPGAQNADYTITWCPFNTVIAQSPNSTTSNPTSSLSSNSAKPSSGTSSTSISAPQPTSPDPSKKHLGGGAIAGIAVGTGGIIVVPFIVWFLIRQKRRKPRELRSPILDESEFQDHHMIDPFVSTPRRVLENTGLTATPFILESGRKGTSAGEKVDLPALPGSETASALQANDEKSATRGVQEGDATSNSFPTVGSSRGADEQEPSHTQQSTLIPNLNRSTTRGDEQGPSDPVDIQRLFEDRAFEGQLLRFIAQRMDPPHRSGSPYSEEDSPPTYRPG